MGGKIWGGAAVIIHNIAWIGLGFGLGLGNDV